MAITQADYEIWGLLRSRKQIPRNPRVLQIGEANWFGDLPMDNLYDLAVICGMPPGFMNKIDDAVERGDAFAKARLFYEIVLNPSDIHAIDLHGTHLAWREDLNYPISLPYKYEIVINTGTLEHIFDIAQAFRTIHDYCNVGGLMHHCFPLRGWFDHGFWNVNPTLLEDLAKANHYELVAAACFELSPSRLTWLECPMRDLHVMAIEKTLGDNVLLYMTWQKTMGNPFKKPRQGTYDSLFPKSVPLGDAPIAFMSEPGTHVSCEPVESAVGSDGT